MSIATDIASLKIMADVFQTADTKAIFTKTAHSLVQTVPYIDWIGIYICEGTETKLVAASCFQDDLRKSHMNELTCPIYNCDDQKIGLMIVRTKQVDAFDPTDRTTLETIAAAIGHDVTLSSL
ncbi:GAF domain-containing protein [Shouchella lonarensis]|uniref:GAF domain-containing protein n=1 Tax=Shouchella lonarensis TaxID=1464122 RepID=UPI000B83D679|nr:GAF domain-containing protein [Shouchella lonarensis]